MPHRAMAKDNVAVITGGASGIGLAAAMHFAALGMKVCIADIGDDALKAAEAKIAAASPGGAANVMAVRVDVSSRDELTALEGAVQKRFGGTDILMNNAGISPGARMFGPLEKWRRVLEVNLWGVINGVQTFAPRMIAHGGDAAIVNTGSKQGITTPPGDPAYNVAKAGVKVVTEQLAHELRNLPDCRVTAHLLIPGFTHTGMTGRGAAKPDAAWTPEQVVDFLLEHLARGDFYILCPDNAVAREIDERRMQWAIDDVIENRPALSRWHPDYAAAFAAFAKKG